MEKPLLVLKPNIVNALIPSLLKDLFYTAIFSVFLFGFFILIRAIGIINYSTGTALFWIILIVFLISSSPRVIQLIILHNTRYFFYRTHVVSEFKFIKIKSESVPYNQIVQITSDISVWDRFCNAGDIHLHTAEEKAPNVVLYFIKDPKKIEHTIHRIAQPHRTPHQHTA